MKHLYFLVPFIVGFMFGCTVGVYWGMWAPVVPGPYPTLELIRLNPEHAAGWFVVLFWITVAIILGRCAAVLYNMIFSG